MWHYDVLRGLDYLRSAGVKADERVADAVDLVERTRDENGRWPLQGFHFERVSFDMEPRVGQASRWNTLRALRVLDWYGKKVQPDPCQSTKTPSTRFPENMRAR